MSARNLPKAIPFEGTRLNYVNKFRPQVIQVASVASSYTGQILFDILSDQDRLLRWPPVAGAAPNEPDFEPLEEPDALDAAANISPQAIAQHTANVKDYKVLQQERGNFFTWLVDSLPPVVRDHIVNFHSLNTRQLLAALDAKYRRIDAKDLRQLRARLDVPYTTEIRMEDHIAGLTHIFAVLAAQNLALPDHAKFHALLSSVQHCSAYDPCIELYEALHPDVATHTFDSLCEALLAYQVRTTRTTMIAAAQHHTLDALTRQVAQLQAQLSARPGPPHLPTAPIATTRTEPPTKYCFTHGLGYHTGHACKNRASGHIPHATADNKMGGSERIATAPAPRRGARPTSN